MKIKYVETMTVDIPFYCDHVTRAMQRAQTHNERVHLCRIETDNGIVGYGDGGVQDVDRLIGQNPFAIMSDDSIGFGAQLGCVGCSRTSCRRSGARPAGRQSARSLPHLLVGYRHATGRLGRGSKGIPQTRLHHL